MPEPATRYLNPDQRDFFAVTVRSGPPAAGSSQVAGASP
jgi:hypothetical protein